MAIAQQRRTVMAAPLSSNDGPRITLASVQKKTEGLPNRYGIYAVEKWGKSSLAAQFPGAIFVQSRGETGLDPLIDAGLLPEIPRFPESHNWEDLTGCVRALRDEDHEYRVAVIDTLNGAERLCHEFVCDRDFDGDWGDKKGFTSFSKGPEVALSEWRVLLSLLDELRTKRRMTVLALMHSRVGPYKNPTGADYDRFAPDMDKRTWALTAKWIDVILFGNFVDAVTNVKENKKTGDIKGKGQGGTERVLYTQGCAAFVAGNRLGLSPEIDMGNSPAEAFANFSTDLKTARERNRAAQTAEKTQGEQSNG